MVRFQVKYDPALVPEGGSEVVASVATLVRASWHEPAGHSFHAAALRQAGVAEEEEDGEEQGGEGGPKAARESPAADSFGWESGKPRKKGKDGVEQDHYALIGLGHLRYLASEDQIRKAYRDAALRHHPDKQAALLLEEPTEEARAARREEIETRFKAIQEAYEVLVDPVKRRNYDSTDEFDDHVPESCSPEEFFKVFGPVFQRNARWSAVQPCPLLGDGDAALEAVDAFYDFWWAFRSWREFPNEDEFDLEQAEGREHRRWMERQNAKLREKAKKEEYARIRLLVENAFRKDPRILKRKEDEKREKLRRKEEKQAARKEKEAEAGRAAEEERARREEGERRAAEEAAAQKKQREKDKKLLRKERARLRALAAECMAPAVPVARGGLSDDAIESLCQALDIEQIKGLCERLEAVAGAPHKAETLGWYLAAVESGDWNGAEPAGSPRVDEPSAEGAPPDGGAGGGAQADAKHSAGAGAALQGNGYAPTEGKEEGVGGRPRGAVAAAAAVAGKADDGGRAREAKRREERPWSKEEVDLLRKGLVKFPKGTSQRWEVVSGYIGTGRGVDEILRAVKTVLLQKPDDSKAFDSFLQKRKSPKDIASPLSSREDAADSISLPPVANGGVPVPRPAVENGVAAGQGKSAAGGEKPPIPFSGGDLKPREEGTPSEESKGREESGAAGSSPPSGSKPANGAASSNTPAAANGAAAAEDGVQAQWTEAQEVALVKALKAFPKETEKRWERIAAAVPGKTKAQCVRKFSSLKESFRNKKGSVNPEGPA